MKKNNIFLSILLIMASIQLFSQEASLTIINKSSRQLTAKIMKGTEKNATFYNTVDISPKDKKTVHFGETGRFFIKNMAILLDKDTANIDTLYNKSNPFEVVADKKRGYSNITMKFTVKESKKPIVDGSIPISRKEYEKD